MWTAKLKDVADRDLTKIEIHEWHLWHLAFVLILFMGSLIVATYLFILGDSFEQLGIAQSTAHRALGGSGVLILLFFSYVIRTRITFGKMKGIIQKQATHDDLTNLYNRRYFEQRIREEITQAHRNKYNLALLLCDLDHFKAINDSLGHQAGDEVLRAAAKSIQESTRGTDLTFRWGGDEIVIILSDTTREGIMIAAERVRRGIHKIARERHLAIDLSIGVALYPEHSRNADQLIRLANQALSIAKKGEDKIHIGDKEYHVDEHAIKIVFQPIMDVWSDELLGYEALGRDPQGKLGILELFKRYQAIGQLNELKRVCFRYELKAAQEAGLKRLFVNVDFGVISQLDTVPKPDDMRVILEISEAEVLHDIENHLEVVTRWRERGYEFAIDDFGAGFISLPFIARLTPDYIKLDRMTVLHAVASIQFRGFLKKLIPALRMYATEGIIAEGIETAEELNVVKDLGIFLVQGFLLGKPQELK